jgi:hypothetical protein
MVQTMMTHYYGSESAGGTAAGGTTASALQPIGIRNERAAMRLVVACMDRALDGYDYDRNHDYSGSSSIASIASGASGANSAAITRASTALTLVHGEQEILRYHADAARLALRVLDVDVGVGVGRCDVISDTAADEAAATRAAIQADIYTYSGSSSGSSQTSQSATAIHTHAATTAASAVAVTATSCSLVPPHALCSLYLSDSLGLWCGDSPLFDGGPAAR